jgi:DNA-binding response OmpR family regulator
MLFLRKEEMKNPESKPPAQERTNSSQRVLVVDDEIYIREILVKALVNLGYESVDAASDGADAWEALHKVSYCLIITDQKMPRITGLELIVRMRSEGMQQPVILISGTLPTEELNRNPGLRVDAMLAKPFTVAALSATMRKLLRATDSPAIANENELPRTEEPAIALGRGQKTPSRRILVVDDDRDSRQLKTDLLTSSGYQVETANDGAAGWEALRTHDYDLVITDDHMPKMTGVEMIEKLYLSHKTVPVIMATGSLPTDAFVRRPWLKPEATLQKPFTIRDLLKVISNVLGADDKNEDHGETPLPKFF